MIRLRLEVYPAVWKVCIPSGNVGFSVFTCSVWVCALSSDSCHLQELWLHRKLWSMWGLLSSGTPGICSLLVQGTDTFTAQASKACSCCTNLGKQNSFSVAVSWKLLRLFILNTPLNVCVCSVSRSVFVVVFSGCLHAPLPQVYLYLVSELIEMKRAEKDEDDPLHLDCCVRVSFLLSSLLRLRPERTDVDVIYASATVCLVHVCFMSTVLQTYSVYGKISNIIVHEIKLLSG